MAGQTVTATGIGGLEALRIFADVLGPACISVDHPRFLRFVPAAPTEASILFDLVVGASSIYAGSWLEGAGAVFAENEALRYITDLAGLPATAGGVFVSGGTAGNLQLADRRPVPLAPPGRGCHGPHSRAAADRQGCALQRRLGGQGDGCRRRRSARRRAGTDVRERHCATTFDALVGRGPATACSRSSPPRGTTNAGVIDDLAGVAAACARESMCGCTSTARTAVPGWPRRACVIATRGIEHADSFIVDPHKWLFAPFDCCALVYRDPDVGRAAHTQHAEYLDVLHARPTTPTRRMEPQRLRPPSVAAGSRPAVLVQPGDTRHRGVPRRHRDHAEGHPRWRRD